MPPMDAQARSRRLAGRLQAVRRASPAFWAAIAGAVLLWMAQPPWSLWPLGWVALAPWFWVAARPQAPRRRGYVWLWTAATLFWLLTLQGVRHAHPAMFLGWIALSCVLGVYAPLSVALIRVARTFHAAGRPLPLWLCGAVVWTGLELVRGYALTGFSGSLLGHTQADVPTVIQVADSFGTYGVTFVLALVSGAVVDVALAATAGGHGWARPALAAIGVTAATLIYGGWRLQQPAATDRAEPLSVRMALVQRNEPVVYALTGEQEDRIFRSYLQGSVEAVRGAGAEGVDVVIWPESMYTPRPPLMQLGPAVRVPEDAAMSLAEFRDAVLANAAVFEQIAASVQRQLNRVHARPAPPELLVGCGVVRFNDTVQQYSGAVHIGPDGEVVDWYGKRHLVMFGEYIPLGHWFPWLYDMLPLSQGVTPGTAPQVMDIAGTAVAPNICFETVVERVTIDQVRQLQDAGTPPDVLVNLTNDAWFRGTSILDHHRRCSQLAAVGCRRPLLMAANTGPTVWIDGCGRLVQSLPVLSDGYIIARPKRDGRWGLYQQIGDWPARGLAAICLLLAVVGLRQRRHRRHLAPQDVCHRAAMAAEPRT